MSEGQGNGEVSPTQDALLQHAKRALYQAGIWCTSELSEQRRPTPEDWGWILDEKKNWIPVWNMLPIATKACSELVKCNCKNQNGCGTIDIHAKRLAGDVLHCVIVNVTKETCS